MTTAPGAAGLSATLSPPLTGRPFIEACGCPPGMSSGQAAAPNGGLHRGREWLTGTVTEIASPPLAGRPFISATLARCPAVRAKSWKFIGYPPSITSHGPLVM